MLSEPSKPSSDAGFKPIGYAAMLHASMPGQPARNGSSRVVRRRLLSLFSDKQGASAHPCPPLTERRGAPTGEPARTQVRVGGGGNSVRQGGESSMQQHMNRLGALLCAGCATRYLESTERETMEHAITDRQVCDWFESQSEEFLRDMFERFGASSPAEVWQAFTRSAEPVHCPCCRSARLEELCHEPPDAQFICLECGTEVNRDGSQHMAGLPAPRQSRCATPAEVTTVKLYLLIAKFDYYVVTNPLPGEWPLSFAITREGIFLFVKPVQFAMLWPWVKL